MVTTITQTQTVFSQAGMGRNISTMHTMVEAVLTLPDQPAAMTRPLSRGHHPQSADGELPDDDDQQRPGGHLADLHKPQHGRRHQHLVRQRVGKLAEVRHQVVLPGDLAIQQVCEAGYDKDGQRHIGGAGKGPNRAPP